MLTPKNKTKEVMFDIVVFAKNHPIEFGVSWLLVFLVFFGALSVVGWVPSELSNNNDSNTPNIIAGPEQREPVGAVAYASASEPLRIIIDAVGIDTTIANPVSRDINVLDEELKKGAVRYPGSANLEDTGNMFLFGHSSYLPNIINEAYQAFNDVEKLEQGDVIRVQSNDKEYVYKVRGVELVNADEAWVDLSKTGKRLTLSTCNTFGKKQERFVVDAEFVGDYPLI